MSFESGDWRLTRHPRKSCWSSTAPPTVCAAIRQALFHEEFDQYCMVCWSTSFTVTQGFSTKRPCAEATQTMGVIFWAWRRTAVPTRWPDCFGVRHDMVLRKPEKKEVVRRGAHAAETQGRPGWPQSGALEKASPPLRGLKPRGRPCRNLWKILCQRGDEEPVKEQKLSLFTDRTKSSKWLSNQLRLPPPSLWLHPVLASGRAARTWSAPVAKRFG